MMEVGTVYAVREHLAAITHCEHAPATSTVRAMEYLGVGHKALRMTYPTMVPLAPAETGSDIVFHRVHWTPGFAYAEVRLCDVLGPIDDWRSKQVDVWADVPVAA